MNTTVESTKPHNPFTGTVYSGENQYRLSATSFKSPEWATFLQWHQNGMKIVKGEHGTSITRFVRENKKNKKTGKVEEVESIRNYVVFNKEQVTQKETNDI